MNITGKWYNELNSVMEIERVYKGEFTGTYKTGVSSGGCAKGYYRIVGRTDADSGGYAIAWVVCWLNDESNCESVTAWSGQAQVVHEEETIIAFWLLTTETPPDKDWTSSHIGKDIFTRNAPATDPSKGPKIQQVSHP